MFWYLLSLLAFANDPPPPAAGTPPPAVPPVVAQPAPAAPVAPPPPQAPPAAPVVPAAQPVARREEEDDDLKGLPKSARDELVEARRAKKDADARAAQERAAREKADAEYREKVDRMEAQLAAERAVAAIARAYPDLEPAVHDHLRGEYDRYVASVAAGTTPLAPGAWAVSDTVTKSPILGRIVAAPVRQAGPRPVNPPHVERGAGAGSAPHRAGIDPNEAMAASYDPKQWALIREQQRTELETRLGRSIGNPRKKA